MSDLVRIKEELTSFRIITLGFVGVILLGAMLLMLPISSQREITTFGNALFYSHICGLCYRISGI